MLNLKVVQAIALFYDHYHMATLIIMWVGAIVGAHAQQEASLTQPPLIETNTLTISLPNDHIVNSQYSVDTTVAFLQKYKTEPLVYVSLVTLEALLPLSRSTMLQTVTEITNSKFSQSTAVGMSVDGSNFLMREIKMRYLAYDFKSYEFIQMYQIVVSPASGGNQYLKLKYLSGSPSSLDSTHQYMLNTVLSGYSDMTLTGTPELYIDAALYDSNAYLLNIQLSQLTVAQLRILRILVDKTDMDSKVNGPGDLVCSVGSIVHLKDPNAIENNEKPDYLPFAMFYGIKGWEGLSFDLPALTYIFNNSNPRVQVNIGYILFQTKSCPANQGYVMLQSLCFGWSAAFYYQLTPETMAPCPYSCYACVGPLSTQCKSCVEGWNRYLSSGRCLCITGFYDPGGPICLNCTEAIQGCRTCSSATNCLTCQTGCNAIGFSPIYCDCPGHVQPDYPYSCPKTFYYEHDTSKCTCLPQTYLDLSANQCFPCELGCYICVSAQHCLVCIDSYILVANRCVFYYNSYVLLGQTSSFNSPEARCLRWDSSNTVCLKTCSRYYYQFNCYGSCPMGTFPISSPWRTCQPCKISCQYCYNFTVCYQCQQNYFYFNSSTFACNNCGVHCKTCVNSSYCSECDKNYLLDNHSCVEQVVAAGVCPSNCSLCLAADQCLACQTGLFLNRTTYLCQLCDSIPGLQINVLGQCIQICGDGIVVYATCDDGNNVGGDGCSQDCRIEAGFNCYTYFSRSYCWNIATGVTWKLYNSFGKNQFILDVTSPAVLSSLLTELACTFNWSLADSKVSDHQLTFWIDYHMPTVLPMDISKVQTYTHISGVNTTNRCYLVVDRISNYSIVVNTVPESLFVDYDSDIEKISQSKLLQAGIKGMLLSSLCLTVIGMAPSSGFAVLRPSLLMLISYLDYYQMPINSFSIYQALQSLTFKEPSLSTKDLVTFSEQYYMGIFWRVLCLYGGMLMLHELLSRYVLKFFEGMDWSFLSKLCKHLRSRKNIAYQFVYTSYEPVLLAGILVVVQNMSLASVGTIFLGCVHVTIATLSKVHLYYSLKELQETNQLLCHSVLADQLQNISLGLMIIFSSADISYTPIILILFASYNLASLVFSEGRLKDDYKISEYIAISQYCISLLMLILCQLLKFANMWRKTTADYESFSIDLGRGIAIIYASSIAVSFVLATIGVAIRVCELRWEGERKEEMGSATVENVSQQSSGNNQ